MGAFAAAIFYQSFARRENLGEETATWQGREGRDGRRESGEGIGIAARSERRVNEKGEDERRKDFFFYIWI